MRIAAGVLLIIMAVCNLIAGVGYAFVGGVAGAGSGFLDEAVKEAQRQGELSDAEVAKFEEDTAKLDEQLGDVAGPLMAYGFGALIGGIIEFIAGIMCFVNKGSTFVMVAGIIEIALTIAITVIIGPGIFIGILLGLVTGGLAIAAANQMKSGPAGPGPDPQMMAGNMPPMG